MILWLFVNFLIPLVLSIHGQLPSYETVKTAHVASEVQLLDRSGLVIHESRNRFEYRRLDWTPLSQMSPALTLHLIRFEDKRFYSHPGVDLKALAHAGVAWGLSQKKRGASTITMQLVGLLLPHLKPKYARRTFFQKIDQIITAIILERRWRKTEILEGYLNLVSFRSELQGITSATNGLFSTHPNALTTPHVALLVSLLRNPNAPPNVVAQRSCTLFPDVSCALLTRLSLAVLKGPYHMRGPARLAPHVFRQVTYLKKNVPRTIQTTLDKQIQSTANKLLRHHLTLLKSENVKDGAILIVENKTGHVLTYVGSSGASLSTAYHVDGVRAKRQAGSTLKPFLYGLAFDTKRLTPASRLPDQALHLPVLGGLFNPKNYDNQYRTWVTARNALASSLNIPAIHTLQLVGLEPFINHLHRLGFSNLKHLSFYGPGLALGTLDISLWELVNAYRTLANKGVYGPLTLTPDPKIQSSKNSIFSEGASYLVSKILSDRQSRSTTFGLLNPLTTQFPTAVKTGTSKDMRDNWCVGYSSHYTVGVWVGNFTGTSMWHVSGISGAAPIWHRLMHVLHHNHSGQPFELPDSIVEMNLPDTNQKEWFMAGTNPRLTQPAIHSPTILYPPDNTQFALDPDIPLKHQSLFFKASEPTSQVTWILNNKVLESSQWTPEAGTHTLIIKNKVGQELDRVTFRVIGPIAST